MVKLENKGENEKQVMVDCIFVCYPRRSSLITCTHPAVAALYAYTRWRNLRDRENIWYWSLCVVTTSSSSSLSSISSYIFPIFFSAHFQRKHYIHIFFILKLAQRTHMFIAYLFVVFFNEIFRFI